ncbi:MAG: response regulator, partial [Treponema sp.]|nr:response regulator [Treponema sp.]
EENLPQLLHGDDIRLKQVLINLTGNAAKFTDKGSIVIRVVRNQEGLVEFSVCDTGIGIKKEDLNTIFSEFAQVDMSMNRTKGGTGLGLAISKNLVRLMGGTLGVSSEYQKGSTFYFALAQDAVSQKTVGEAYAPLIKEALADKKNPSVKDIDSSLFQRSEFSALFATNDSASFSKDANFIAPDAKVLVVDDNLVNIQVAEGMLQKFSIVPDTALSGLECLEMLSEKSYDLVFMDHQMPVMDGVETLIKIRGSESNSHTVVIALSANAINGAREMFIQKGFDDFLSKPVQIKDFAMALKKWLPQNLIKSVDENSSDASSKNEWTCPPSVIKTFVRLIDPTSLEIEDALAKSDLKTFTIKVHALKSSAKIVGADELSKLAAELEELGSKCDCQETLSLIQKKTEKLLALYKSCKQLFAKEHLSEKETEGSASGGDALSNEPDAAVLTAKDAESFANKILSACDQNNLNDLESLVAKLQNFSLTSSQKKILEQLKDAAELIDFDRAKEIAATLIAQ